MTKLTALLISFLTIFSSFALAENREKTRVLLTVGGHGFDQKRFYAMFKALPNVEYTVAPMPESAKLLKPGLEKDYDVIVMYDMVKSITAEEQSAFIQLLKSGIAVISLHHNLGAHRDWEEFSKIIGGRYHFAKKTADGQTGKASTYTKDQNIKVKVSDKTHPITKGLEDFEIPDETYQRCSISKDATVLLSTDHPKSDAEIAWVHQYEKSLVFYLKLGDKPSSWKHPAYPILLSNSIHWLKTESKKLRLKSTK